jgi:putative ABC transport system permease protein
MASIWGAIRIGLLDMRGDLRRFLLLVVCLAVGTALISGVNSVGSSITRAIDDGAAELMGGDVELSRADRLATSDERATMDTFGAVSTIVDTNLRAESATGDAFVDLTAVGPTYPLLGQVLSPQLPPGESVHQFLAPVNDVHGALVDPVLLDQLGLAIGDSFGLGGTEFQVRGTLTKLPDGPVRGFRLGLTAVVTDAGFAAVSDAPRPCRAWAPGIATSSCSPIATPKPARPPSKQPSPMAAGPCAPPAMAWARWCATTTSSCASWSLSASARC